MLVYQGKFFGSSGEELTIVSQNKLFTRFSDGTKWMTCEIDLKVRNEASTKAVSISNRIELERRRAK